MEKQKQHKWGSHTQLRSVKGPQGWVSSPGSWFLSTMVTGSANWLPPPFLLSLSEPPSLWGPTIHQGKPTLNCHQLYLGARSFYLREVLLSQVFLSSGFVLWVTHQQIGQTGNLCVSKTRIS